MCLFKKKKKVVISGNKYRVGENIKFKKRDDVNPGIIYAVKLDKDGNIIYDVQIGGECPAIISDIQEKDIFPR